MKSVLFFCLIIPCFLYSQKDVKEKYSSEKLLNFKVGTTANFTNDRLYRILNYPNTDVLVPIQNPNYNPLAVVEFENHFSKYIGLSLGVGFMQTRHNYKHTSMSLSTSISNGSKSGLIICNIPHFNINPSFYIKNTRIFGGLGIYKYYYSFKPMDVGNLSFDLNSEGLALYSNIGITQSFDVKTYKLTLTLNYFGLTKNYDSGLQIAIGLAL